jgi:hypothetical protein
MHRVQTIWNQFGGPLAALPLLVRTVRIERLGKLYLWTCARHIGAEPARETHGPRPPRTWVLTPSSRDLPAGIGKASWSAVLTEAANAWHTPCANVRLEVSTPADRWLAERDGVNLFVFREQVWCHNAQCGHTATFPLRAMAMTTVYPEGARGADVAEADVELNASSFEFTIAGAAPCDSTYTAGPLPGAPKWKVPLKNVLVHEIGHTLGLQDACRQGQRPSGRPVLGDCGPSERNSAMAMGAPLDRPTRDDLIALCNLYPRTTTAQQGLPAPEREGAPGSCAFSAGHPGNVVAVTAAAALVYVARRRMLRLLRCTQSRKHSAAANEHASRARSRKER